MLGRSKLLSYTLELIIKIIPEYAILNEYWQAWLLEQQHDLRLKRL